MGIFRFVVAKTKETFSIFGVTIFIVTRHMVNGGIGRQLNGKFSIFSKENKHFQSLIQVMVEKKDQILTDVDPSIVYLTFIRLI